jgi:hypothetical protein
MMKTLLAGLLVLSFLTVASFAQQKVDTAGGVTLGPNTAHATSETCVEVEVGGEKASRLDCLNQQLKQQVERVQPVGNTPPLDASSPAVKVGGFNEAGVSQQFGQNFGKSVTPFRPTKP